MHSDGAVDRAARQAPRHTGDPLDGSRSYRVLLEGLGSEIEALDSFAIKFALLSRAPLSKVKHLVRRLPATIWTGQGRSTADRILALIEEAGGRGTIVEVSAPSPAADAGGPKRKTQCRWCGFPINEGETICGFCRMPVDGGSTSASESSAQKRRISEKRNVPGKSGKANPRNRLLLYAVILVLGILVVRFLAR